MSTTKHPEASAHPKPHANRDDEQGDTPWHAADAPTAPRVHAAEQAVAVMHADASPAAKPVTADEAIDHAARLLHHAELETDLAKLDRLDSLASSWLNMAALINDRDHHAA